MLDTKWEEEEDLLRVRPQADAEEEAHTTQAGALFPQRMCIGRVAKSSDLSCARLLYQSLPV